MALIQFRCPLQLEEIKTQTNTEHTGNRSPSTRQRETSEVNLLTLDLGLAAARTERKQISVYATQPMPLCYSSPINRKTY